jgi:hypothetical protein
MKGWLQADSTCRPSFIGYINAFIKLTSAMKITKKTNLLFPGKLMAWAVELDACKKALPD